MMHGFIRFGAAMEKALLDSFDSLIVKKVIRIALKLYVI